jgi:hypothetical protein
MIPQGGDGVFVHQPYLKYQQLGFVSAHVRAQLGLRARGQFNTFQG